MGVLTLVITTARSSQSLTNVFERVGPNHSVAQACSDFINSVQTGTELAQGTGQPPSIAISVQGNAVRASATLTCVSVIQGDTVVINGVTFTAKDATTTANEFVRAVSNTTTATNLAASINASVTALVAGYVTATSALGVVTVYSTNYGLQGNMVTLTTTGGTITASSATLIGGANDATAQTLNF